MAIEGRVEFSRAGLPGFRRVRLSDTLLPGDHVRIGPRSLLTVSDKDRNIVRLNEMSEFQIQQPEATTRSRFRFRLLRGILYFFHRGGPGVGDVETPFCSAAVRGTEFTIEVNQADTTILTVIDGEVELYSGLHMVAVRNSEQGVAAPGKAPVVRAAIDVVNVIQWTLYYPGVLDVDELPLGLERNALAASIQAYRSGDLVRAMAAYGEREPQSDAEKVYLAALLLSVGQVDDAEPLLASIPRGGLGNPERIARLAEALHRLIQIVKVRPVNAPASPDLATEWMVESYREQSLFQMERALAAARQAAQKSPRFGFAWARVAELEFGFGRVDKASDALDTGLKLADRNAQAHALKGFLFAAENRMQAATAEFNRAIEIDSGLATAWLGRGLVSIRTANFEAGHQDLLAAAALDPQRAFLRSYLGKAWADAGERKLAEQELELARDLDPRDPTAWLYSALLQHQYNQVNEAVRHLERSQEFNNNRAAYRSRFLLDQDRAVRSANLAHIYRDAGMREWSVREAGRAVNADYGNHSAHLFLADSYLELSDPQLANLRYGTPANAEYLIANLLAPPGGGLLSPALSQGEYSRLFESDGFGLVSSTEYLSRGAWTQSAAQFGTFGNFAYTLDAFYRTDPGQHPNGDIEVENYSLRLKHQLSLQDSFYLQVGYLDLEGGDVFQRYDPAAANMTYRFSESQKPSIGIGYHRAWSPESHTLFFATRFEDELKVSDALRLSYLIQGRDTPDFKIDEVIFGGGRYRNETEIYSVEAQQIWRQGAHQLIGGYRLQLGEMNPANTLWGSMNHDFNQISPEPVLRNRANIDFHRHSLYGYYSLSLSDSLLITAGLSYDHASHPENFLDAAVSSDTRRVNRVSPKAGFIWTPSGDTVLRAGLAHSIGGAGLDQDLRIEPTQVAGFNQFFRSLIPESFGGSTPREEFEMYAVSFEHRFPTHTYLIVAAERLASSGRRLRGGFEGVLTFPDPEGPPELGIRNITLREDVDFREDVLLVTINQLAGDQWSFGLEYRLADAHHENSFPGLAPGLFASSIRPAGEIESTLHTVSAQAIFNDPSGWFAVLNGAWYAQDIDGYAPALKDDDFYQLNFIAGYRFPRRRAELSLGILNITDQGYRLLPLNLHPNFPRERTLYVRLRWEL